MKKFISLFWFLTITGLFLYSFTQVDLNLTLSKVPLINNTIRAFQSIGYFQRPLSTVIFLSLTVILYTLYFILLLLSRKGQVSQKEFWFLLIGTSAVLLFSYPAFSYDLFNYMFDAKTIVFYQSNPWQYRPLDFIGDNWLSFMHWTHRASVYPPFWVFLTLPFYFFGFNIFLLILFNFKLLMTISFLGSVLLLERLLEDRKDKLFLLSFYAFNPLMLIESLVSAHNDIVMMFFVLLSFWLLAQKRNVLSVVCLLLSVMTKYITAVLLPIFVFAHWLKKRVGDVAIYRYSLFLLVIAFVFAITKMEIQPWYLVWLMPFIVLSNWKILWPVTIGFSLGLLLRYAPFLYQGNWDNPVPVYKFWFTLTPLAVSLLITLLLRKKQIV